MKEILTRFLTQLTIDVNLVNAYRQNELETMLSFGLTPECCDMVINKNYDEISNLLGTDFSISTNHVIRAYKSTDNLLNKRFTEFLTLLSTEQELVKSFKNDAENTMKHFGLTQKCIDLVISKDYDSIQNMLGADYSIATDHIIKVFGIKSEQKIAS